MANAIAAPTYIARVNSRCAWRGVAVVVLPKIIERQMDMLQLRTLGGALRLG